VVSNGVVRYHAGGGIVADSDPERELAEAWLKTAALRLALGEDARPELERCSSG
jgi:isochorismate synthase EntC